MTATNETYNERWITALNRRVSRREDGLYYVEQFQFDKYVGSIVKSRGSWQAVGKGYAHSTSAFAALGRMFQKANKTTNF